MRVLREAAPYLGLGTSLAATVAVAVGIGYWLDARFGTQPAFALGLGVVGVVVALVHFVGAVSRMGRKP